MNIVLITQDDPFYLAENLDYLIRKMPAHSTVSGCVLFDVSPFGRRETLLQKTLKTLKIFGAGFTARYGIKMIKNKFDPKKSVFNVLSKHNIPVIRLNSGINTPESLETIAGYVPDLLISIAGNQIFRQSLIELAPKGCLNLHTALLPKYRGLMPSFWVLKNNERNTGVSVFFVDEGIDSGPILVQKMTVIGDMSQEELIKHTKRLGMDAIIEAVEMIERGGYDLIENDDSQQTYNKFPTREDVREFLRKGKRFY